MRKSVSVIFDDIAWDSPKGMNGLVDSDGRQVIGGSYVKVEELNPKTTALLKQIAVPETDHTVSCDPRPDNERWTAERIIWNVNDELSAKYGARFVIEQGKLYYRGTWIKITACDTASDSPETADMADGGLAEKLNRFCADYGFSTRKQIVFDTPYDLPWPEGQKKREDEDDRTDSFFDSMD